MPEIDWIAEVAPPTPARFDSLPKPGRPASVQPALVQPETAPLLVPPLTWGQWASAHRNQLLVAAVVLVAVGAVALRRHRQRLEELPRIVEAGRTEGISKLDSGDFFAAKKLLADAADAVDALGSHDEGATAIRQAAREAALLADVVPATLEDLVEEAATFEASGWAAHFRSKYQGRSIVIETTITAAPEPNKPGSRFEDAYRILVGRGTTPKTQGRIGYDGFRLFEASPPKPGETKLFGARLARLELDLTDSVWVLALEPDSGSYITHSVALRSLGWPAGEPVEGPTP